MKVYERIRYLRQDRNMSQEDLGRLLGVTYVNCSLWGLV